MSRSITGSDSTISALLYVTGYSPVYDLLKSCSNMLEGEHAAEANKRSVTPTWVAGVTFVHMAW